MSHNQKLSLVEKFTKHAWRTNPSKSAGMSIYDYQACIKTGDRRAVQKPHISGYQPIDHNWLKKGSGTFSVITH